VIHTELDRARTELSRLERRARECRVADGVIEAIVSDRGSGRFSAWTLMFAIWERMQRSMNTVIEFVLQLKTVSELNSHEHWRERNARAKDHRQTASVAMVKALGGTREDEAAVLYRRTVKGKTIPAAWQRPVAQQMALGIAWVPCTVTMTRISPRGLDSGDNLSSSTKSCRDGIADALGINDRDPRVTWLCLEERGGVNEYAVKVRVVREGGR